MEISQSDLHEAFSLFDTKGDGKIAAAQLGDVLRALGQNPTEADVHKFGFAKKPGKTVSPKVLNIQYIYSMIILRIHSDSVIFLPLLPTTWEFYYSFVPSVADERISFETFIPILHEVAKVRSTYRPEEFIEGFRHFDKDQSGNINSAELRHALTTLGNKLHISIL